MTVTIARKSYPFHAIEKETIPPRDSAQTALDWLAPVLQAGGYVVDEEMHFHDGAIIEAVEPVAFSGCTFIWHGKEPPMQSFRGPISLLFCTIDTSECEPEWGKMGVIVGKTEAWKGVQPRVTK
jgi:hypothetical protein